MLSAGRTLQRATPGAVGCRWTCAPHLEPGPASTWPGAARYNAAMAIKGAGGTSGGIGTFLLGLGMTVVGGYLLLNQVTVHSGFWSFWGGRGFGLTLVPLLVGIGFLFFNGRSVVGWLLSGAGALIILAGVIVNLEIYFRPTSLFNTLLMLALLAGGLGLVARSLTAGAEKGEPQG